MSDSRSLFGCSIDAAQQQMALNFELVVNDQLLSVVLAAYKLFKISAPELVLGGGICDSWTDKSYNRELRVA